MSLRNEIRAILQQELAALGMKPQSLTETVSITSSADLNRFVAELLVRASNSDIVDRISNGQLRFELAQSPTPQSSVTYSSTKQSVRGAPELSSGVYTGASTVPLTPRPLVSSPQQRGAKPIVEKKLLTERDVAALESDLSTLRISKHTRLTPLARDELNRRGIRLQRIEQ